MIRRNLSSFVLGLLTSTLLTTCAHIPKYEVPESVQPFINVFENASAKYAKPIKIVDLIVEFEELEYPVVGECHPDWLNTTPTLVLDVNYWTAARPMEKEVLILHELGHCYLGLLHDDTKLSNGKHRSIMNSEVISPSEYALDKDYYQKELFESVDKKISIQNLLDLFTYGFKR